MNIKWFNSMFSNEELEHKYRLSKSLYSLCPIRYSSGSEDPVINDMEKNVSSWSDSGSCNFSSVAHFFDIIDIIDILSFISDDTFLVRDSNNGDSYSIYFDIENRIFEIDNDSTFLNKLESSFSSYLNSSYMSSGSKSSNRYYYHYMYDTQSSWNNHINSYIGSYLRFEISIDSYIPGGTHNYSDSYFYSFICNESNESKRSDDNINQNFKHLWVMCENCYGQNYKKFFKSKLNICEYCGYHLKMSSSDRIELLIDPGTWDPLDESMVSTDPIEFNTSPIEFNTSPIEFEFHTSPIEFNTSPIEFEFHTSPIEFEFHTSPIEFEFHTSPIEFHTSPIEFHTSPIEFHTSPIEFHTSPIEFHTSPIEFNTSPIEFNKDPIEFLYSEEEFYKDCIDSYMDPVEFIMDPIEFLYSEDEFYKDCRDSYQYHMDSYSSQDGIDSDQYDMDSYSYQDRIDSDQYDMDSYSYQDRIDFYPYDIRSYSCSCRNHMDSSPDHTVSYQDHMDFYRDPMEFYRDPIDSYRCHIDSDQDHIDSDLYHIDSYFYPDLMDYDPYDLDQNPYATGSYSYSEHIDSYQEETGLTDAVQTGIGQLNGIPVAIGVMDFQFMGGSMGSVVGEKITRLIEYATNRSLPVIIVCASGGARMQEGSFSLMQMAKISSALYNYKLNKKLFYVSILTSPTTGGVTASFGMSGDIIIAEPNAYIAFAGKRVIEQTLNKTVPEGSQEAEYSFYTGLVDPIVPRNLLKGVLGELFQLHGFLPLTSNLKNESTALDSVICSEQ